MIQNNNPLTVNKTQKSKDIIPDLNPDLPNTDCVYKLLKSIERVENPVLQ